MHWYNYIVYKLRKSSYFYLIIKKIQLYGVIK